MTPSLGRIMSTWYVQRSPEASASSVVFLSSSPSLFFFSTSNHTSSHLLTTVMLSGLAAQKMKLFDSKSIKLCLLNCPP